MKADVIAGMLLHYMVTMLFLAVIAWLLGMTLTMRQATGLWLLILFLRLQTPRKSDK